MDSNHKPYDYQASFRRIREILGQPDVAYEETKTLPDRDRLTFTNGFYAYCCALFIDIRDSASLPSKHRRPTLARLYRAYLSEVVAILNSDTSCREVNIVGDGAWAVYNTPGKADLDRLFVLAARLNSMIKAFNRELARAGISPVRVGIGLSYGRALMIKAGYNGSGLSDVVYMGDVVNEAAHLAAQGNETADDKTAMLSSVFVQNLKDAHQALVTWRTSRGCWHGDMIMPDMDKWYEANLA